MKAGRKTGVSAGLLSLLSAFVVLALAAFAVLSFASARADYDLTERAAQAVTEYYAADGQAEENYAELVGLLSAPDWESALQSAGYAYEKAGQTCLISYEIQINKQKYLAVRLSVPLDEQGTPSGTLERIGWQAVPRD